MNTNTYSEADVKLTGRTVLVCNRWFQLSHMMCFVVVYEDGVALVHADDEQRKAIAKEIKARVIEQSGDVAVYDAITLGEMIDIIDDYAQHYKRMPLETLLKGHPHNRFIPVLDVDKVVFTKSHFDYLKDQGTRKEGKLNLITPHEKIKLTHKYRDDDEIILMALRATFSNALI